MNVGSLFSGIGGFDIGFQRAGFDIAWQVEIDEYCRKVLKKHWPDVPKYGDIKELTGKELAPVDVICGGFPCQDISVAGKGVGIHGSRSSLWFEMLRIIRVVRPRIVVVENVPALLSRGMGKVLWGLAEGGYDAEWDCIPAAAVGADHRRDRVFVVGYTREGGLRRHDRRWAGAESTDGRAKVPHANGGGQQISPQLDGTAENHPADGHPQGRYTHGSCDVVANAESKRVEGSRADRFIFSSAHVGTRLLGSYRAGTGADQWAVEPDVGRVAHGVPKRVDRLRALGNAIVPQVAEWIAQRISEKLSFSP